MASLAEQNFNLFSQQQQEEYSHFADATHNPVFTSAPMDLGMTADAFSFVQRAPSQEHYSTSPSTISFEYTTDPASTYMMNSAASPGVYGDDLLSNMSTGSASSSAVGSPLSSHGQTGMDLAQYGGLGIQPSIAGEYYDFSAYAHGMEDVTPYDFTGLAPTKSYVACRGKISSLGDQLSVAAPLPAGLPLRPSVAAEEPRTRWCRIPAFSTAQALHSQPGGAQSPLCSCRIGAPLPAASVQHSA
ncbi:hypothetical protein TGAMA5MH_08067 [Trichoderma gamsii]|uniref:Uncharacterized protein n=1 Tax=Trichoderma gamsii TaxID=398673 RepID=A0A2K0T3Q4_9HYPO|nr:hypothetical protein TGAMA5MH_08067 [Trichoderma gamsii]